MRLDPLWQDPEVVAKPVSPSGDGACRFAAPPVIDLREDLELVGVINRRKLLSPDARAPWLRSMLSGLVRRGIDLELLAASNEMTSDRTLTVLSLRSAWVDYYQGVFTSVVTFDLTLQGRSLVTRTIRGRATTTDFLGDIRSRADDAFRKSVGKALDEVAVAMHSSCS